MTISSLSRALVLGCTLVLAACGGEGLTLPPDGAPAHIEVRSGNNQNARVGSTLSDSLVVKVTDTQDRPVAGANVVIDFSANGSAASPATVSTDSDGRAASSLVLGTVPGQINGTVGVPVAAGVTPVQAGFVATALAADANGIALVSGNGQSGPVGTALTAPLVVAVTDAFQNPISGVTVNWSVDAGGGSVSSATTVTDGNGQASVTRTVGNTAGDWTTLATAAGLAGSPVTFTHTATAGNAARVIIVDGNGQSAPAGSKLPKDLVVQLLDDQNNPIPNRAVSWVIGVGDGSASPETSNTDGNGRAKTQWTLGAAPGPNTLTAVVSGVGNAAFNATGTKLGSTTRITSHQPEPSIVGTPVTVGVTVDGSGGTPTGQVTVGGEGALAPCSITLSNGSGSCQLVMTQLGNRDLTATYAGDSRFTGSSDGVKHQVAPTPNSAPTAAFTPPANCTVGQACQFNDGSSDPDGTIASRSWVFEDGNPATSSDQNPSVTFNSSGNKTVTLTVTDNDGATGGPTSHTVNVAAAPNSPPTATDDGYTTTMDAGFHAPGPNGLSLIANDTDSDGGTLSTTPTPGPVSTNMGGTVTIGSDGSFDYTPPPLASGIVDSFTYTVNDGQGGSDTGTATVTIP